jgi:hypothetical protein
MYNASILEDAHVLTNLAAFNATLASCRIAVDTIVVLKVGGEEVTRRQSVVVS